MSQTSDQITVREGIVTHSVGSAYEVLTEDGETHTCRIKGKLRIQGIRTTNPVAVGDKVVFEDANSDRSVIKSIIPRRNSIIRKAVKLSRQAHVIAANVDKAYLITTLTNPPTSTGFIDRFLAAAESDNIPVCIVFNKIDLYDEHAMELMEQYRTTYQNIGYECIGISAFNETDIEMMRSKMGDQVNLLSGHSGVGKSTLINGIAPSLNLKTGNTSSHYHLGKHTTTFAEMFALPTGGYIIDTPGIKGFGIVYMEKDDIMNHFPEIAARKQDCKFTNCVHISEPVCAVKAALDAGDIAHSRYQSYLSIYHTDDNETYR